MGSPMPMHSHIAAPSLSCLDGSELVGQARIVYADGLPINLTPPIENVRSGHEYRPCNYQDLLDTQRGPLHEALTDYDPECVTVGYLRGTSRRFVLAYFIEDTFTTNEVVKKKINLIALPYSDRQNPGDQTATFTLCDEQDLRDQCGSVGLLPVGQVLSWDDVDFFARFRYNARREPLGLREVWLRVESELHAAEEEEYNGYGRLWFR